MKKLILFVSTLGLATSVAVASDHANPKTFGQLDVDRDGVLTKSEAAAEYAVLAQFGDADADQDGYLSRGEFDSLKVETEEAE